MSLKETDPSKGQLKSDEIHEIFDLNVLDKVTNNLNYLVLDKTNEENYFSKENKKENENKNIYPIKEDKKKFLESISQNSSQVCHLENSNQKMQPKNIFANGDFNISKILGDLKLYPVTIKVEKVENSCSNIPYIKIKNCNKEKKNNDINRIINNYPLDKEKLIDLFNQERGMFDGNINYNDNNNYINGISNNNCDINKRNPQFDPRRTTFFDKINNESNTKGNNFLQLFSVEESSNNNIMNNTNINNNINNISNKGEQKEQKTKKQLNVRLGDWACKQCNNLNFSFRDKCNRCGLAKEIVGYEINENLTLNRNLASLNSISKNINNNYNNKYNNINYNNNQMSS